jgi:uncharacterized membrane-anchored protein YitT (DUF2179 family)
MKLKEKVKPSVKIKENIKSILFITIGIFSASFGLKGFLLPNHFIDGGVTGISLLVEYVSHISLSILIFVINLPFIFLAYKQISKIFINFLKEIVSSSKGVIYPIRKASVSPATEAIRRETYMAPH